MQIVETNRKSEFVYDSARRGPAELEELRGVYQYRDLVIQWVRRDVVARYKRSFLGVAWTMLKPLGIMLVMTIVFSRVFQGIKGYPVYVLSGLLVWNFFSQTTTVSMAQMAWGNILFNKIYMPRTVFTISAVGTELVNLILSLVPLSLIMLIAGVSFHISLLMLPVSIFILAAFSLGVSLFLSTLAVYFPDLAQMYQVVLTAWMYLTPIIYPKDVMPEQYRWILLLNPMYYVVETFRQPVFNGVFPPWPILAISLGIAIIMLVVGWIFFSRSADNFAYYV
jgi:ABC-type polysaccharide/polyol phosphate export permease